MEKFVAVVVIKELSETDKILKALKNNGINCAEITFRTACAAEAIEYACKIYPDLSIGAGTVITEKQVELTKKAGGKFIISPDTYENVIRKTRELDMVSMPGALTPTEIQKAYRCGADFVKLFPITNLGTEYVKAVKAPLSHIKFMAVGGINENNMADYLKAGVCGFGIGSNIVNKKFIDSGDYASITQLAKKYTGVTA